MSGKNLQNKKSKRFTATWVTAFILVVLVLASSVLAALAVNKQETTSEVISLTPDEVNDEGKRTYYDLFYEPISGYPDIELDDGNGGWLGNTGINLFKSSYTNEQGKTTVEAANGNNVIAPGTSNTYKFTIMNKTSLEVKYSVSIKGLFGLTDKNVPITLRLRKGADWIIGSDSEWVNAKALSETVNTFTVEPKKSDVYSLEWQWPFDVGNDAEDNALANAKIDVDNDFNMTITTVSEFVKSPSSVDENGTYIDENGNYLYRRRLMEPTVFITLASIGLLSIVLCIVVLCVVKRRKKADIQAAAEAASGVQTQEETAPDKKSSKKANKNFEKKPTEKKKSDKKKSDKNPSETKRTKPEPTKK